MKPMQLIALAAVGMYLYKTYVDRDPPPPDYNPNQPPPTTGTTGVDLGPSEGFILVPSAGGGGSSSGIQNIDYDADIGHDIYPESTYHIPDRRIDLDLVDRNVISL